MAVRRRGHGHGGGLASRHARPRTVRLGLTEEEFAELEQAAGRAGLAKGAYAAEAALAAARGKAAAPDAAFQDALAELMRAAGLVRRIGVNLNQAVAKLNATGQPAGDLVPCAQVMHAPRGAPGCRGGPAAEGDPVRSGWHSGPADDPPRRGWRSADADGVPGSAVRDPPGADHDPGLDG